MINAYLTLAINLNSMPFRHYKNKFIIFQLRLQYVIMHPEKIHINILFFLYLARQLRPSPEIVPLDTRKHGGTRIGLNA